MGKLVNGKLTTDAGHTDTQGAPTSVYDGTFECEGEFSLDKGKVDIKFHG
jgi:hypothetical protein